MMVTLASLECTGPSNSEKVPLEYDFERFNGRGGPSRSFDIGVGSVGYVLVSLTALARSELAFGTCNGLAEDMFKVRDKIVGSA